MSPTIAVVEDDDDLRALLVEYLTLHDYAVWAVNSAEDFYRQLPIKTIDILILDLGLPGEGELELIRHLGKNVAFSIMVLSANSNPQEKVYALTHGADRYLTKPVYFEEVMANIEAIWRAKPTFINTEMPHPEHTSWTVMSKERLLVTPDGQKVSLTYKEYTLLCCLSEHAGHCSRDDVIAFFGHKETYNDYQRMDVMLSRLRKKVKTETNETLPINAIPVNRLLFSQPLILIEE